MVKEVNRRVSKNAYFQKERDVPGMHVSL